MLPISPTDIENTAIDAILTGSVVGASVKQPIRKRIRVISSLIWQAVGGIISCRPMK